MTSVSSPSNGSKTGKTIALRPRPLERGPGDSGLAALFIDFAGEDVRYLAKTGEWYGFDGRRWITDGADDLIGNYFSQLAKAIESDPAKWGVLSPGVNAAISKAAEAMGRPEDGSDACKHAKTARTTRGSKAAQLRAQGDPRVQSEPDDFDQRPELINFENGTLDLRSGELRPHRRGDMLTRMVKGLHYDPDATCPTWLRFMEEMQPDPEVRQYLREIAGSGMTGHPVRQLFLNVGVGKNGKSVFWETVRDALGLGEGYGHAAESNILTARRTETSYDIALLEGKRLVTVAETDEGSKLSLARAKQLTGEASVQAAQKYKVGRSFAMNATFIMHTNSAPVIDDDDQAIWDRLRLIPWDQRAGSPAEVEAGEAQVLDNRRLIQDLKAEWPGVLAWAACGAKTWLANGQIMSEPQSVTDASQAYRAGEDSIGQFIDEKLRFGPPIMTQISRKDLVRASETWHEELGLPVPGNRELFKYLRSVKGAYKVECPPGSKTVRGLRALTSSEEEEEDRKEQEARRQAAAAYVAGAGR